MFVVNRWISGEIRLFCNDCKNKNALDDQTFSEINVKIKCTLKGKFPPFSKMKFRH